MGRARLARHPRDPGRRGADAAAGARRRHRAVDPLHDPAVGDRTADRLRRLARRHRRSVRGDLRDLERSLT